MPRPIKRFTNDELATMRKLSMEGVSYKKIAKQLGRQESSVRMRLRATAIQEEIAETGTGKLKWTRTGVPYLEDEDTSR